MKTRFCRFWCSSDVEEDARPAFSPEWFCCLSQSCKASTREQHFLTLMQTYNILQSILQVALLNLMFSDVRSSRRQLPGSSGSLQYLHTSHQLVLDCQAATNSRVENGINRAECRAECNCKAIDAAIECNFSSWIQMKRTEEANQVEYRRILLALLTLSESNDKAVVNHAETLIAFGLGSRIQKCRFKQIFVQISLNSFCVTYLMHFDAIFRYWIGPAALEKCCIEWENDIEWIWMNMIEW